MSVLGKEGLLKQSIHLLSPRDRYLLVVAACVQVALSFLDLAGVALIGVLGALSVNGVQSRTPGNRVKSVLDLLNLGEQTFQVQAGALAALAGCLLLMRTLISMYFSRRIMYFLSRRGANISSKLVSKLLNQDLLQIQNLTVQRSIFAVTSGVSTLTLVVLGGVVSLVSDLSLLIVLTFGLVFVDYKLAICTFLLFGIVVIAMYRMLNKRVQQLGESESQLNISSNEKISEILNSYRENTVRGRRLYYANLISKHRIELAATQAEISFMPNISKYVIEASLVIGGFAIGAIQFKLQDATHAVGTLSIFLAAGSRIAPALLRVQQVALSFKGAAGSAEPTLKLIESLENIEQLEGDPTPLDLKHIGFTPQVSVTNVNLFYPGSELAALSNVSLSVSPGETIAILGPSGAGKTSLVDVILGVLPPSTGEVKVSGFSPLLAIQKWPGAISYVPQDVTITNESVKRNIALGYSDVEIDENAINRSINFSRFDVVLENMKFGVETIVGERGTKLSGGQKQRLGIARAIYTNPRLLVLDEATSALDGQTEADISTAIQSLRGEVTVILIAHRLSTARHADKVYYLEEGRIVASGTFDHVRKTVPNFDLQARLMGL